MIANQGLEGFVDALMNSQEYLEAFGLEYPFRGRDSAERRSALLTA